MDVNKEINNILHDTLRVEDGQIRHLDEAVSILENYFKKHSIQFTQFVGCEEPEMDAIYDVFTRLG